MPTSHPTGAKLGTGKALHHLWMNGSVPCHFKPEGLTPKSPNRKFELPLKVKPIALAKQHLETPYHVQPCIYIIYIIYIYIHIHTSKYQQGSSPLDSPNLPPPTSRPPSVFVNPPGRGSIGRCRNVRRSATSCLGAAPPTGAAIAGRGPTWMEKSVGVGGSS